MCRVKRQISIYAQENCENLSWFDHKTGINGAWKSLSRFWLEILVFIELWLGSAKEIRTGECCMISRRHLSRHTRLWGTTSIACSSCLSPTKRPWLAHRRYPQHPLRYDTAPAKGFASMEIASVVLYFLKGGIHFAPSFCPLKSSPLLRWMTATQRNRWSASEICKKPGHQFWLVPPGTDSGGQALSVMLTCMHTACK